MLLTRSVVGRIRCLIRHPALFAALAGLLVGTAKAQPLQAQSIVRGDLVGTVGESIGSPLGGVQVTVSGRENGVAVFTETENAGAFRVSLLDAGEYDIRAEARGFIPRIVTGVVVRSGQATFIDIELTPAPPPVERVDTVPAGTSERSRFDALGSRWISRAEIEQYSDPRASLTDLATLAASSDGAFGFEGLPGTSTELFVDGVRFVPARHPSLNGVASAPLVSRIGLAGVGLHARQDVEWAGSAGASVALASRSARTEPGVELFASGSSSALWQTEAFSDLDKPDGTSVWAQGTADIPMSEGRAALFVGAEGLRSQMPRISPVSAESAGRIVFNSSSLVESDVDDLVAPWLSTLQAVSVVSRLDWRRSETSDVSLRGGFTNSQIEGARFFGPSPDYGSSPPFEGTDGYLSASALSHLNDQWSLEMRGALQRSERTWDGTRATIGEVVTPSVLLSESASLGGDPSMYGRVARTAFVANMAAHVRWTTSSLKLGLAASFPSYEYEYTYGSSGFYVLTRPESTFLDSGLFTQTRGTVRSHSFTAPEIGGFVQYQWTPARDFRATAGLRFDYEVLPDGEAPRNAEWEQLTGITNNEIRSGLQKLTPGASLWWDVSGNGGSVIEASIGLSHDQLDPGAIAEVFSRSGALDDYVQLGGVDRWPAEPSGSEGTSAVGTGLTLFGPDVRAPRTARGTVGLSQQLGSSAALHLSGRYRRSEFLIRRGQLNRPVVESGELSDGRALFGTLEKRGLVVAPAPGTNRRFEGFGDVWALNSDGWSEYVGITASVEAHLTDSVDWFGTYTFSSTEDNLVGAALAVPAARLDPGLGAGFDEDWTSGTSDFDIPHRISTGIEAMLPLLEGLRITGIYRYRSGWPFTPGYQPGVDLNGDGSGFNDPAFIPADVSSLETGSECLGSFQGTIVSRNACRGDGVHALDFHLELAVTAIRSAPLSLVIDAFNLTDSDLGRPESTLLRLEEDDPLLRSGVVTTVPTALNPAFGTTRSGESPGRMFRIGLRLGRP